jgi:bla regulator protein blaR1
MDSIFTTGISHWFSAWVWALIHSLWIGLVAALLFYAILQYAHGLASRIKYLLGLGLVALVPFCTFLCFLSALPFSSSLDSITSLSTSDPLHSLLIHPAMISLSWTDRITAHASTIFSIWLLGVCLLSIRTAWGYREIYKIKQSALPLIDSRLQEVFNKIYHRAGYTGVIQIASHPEIANPSTVGYLKPMILLPVSIVNQLSLEETYAVLAHEMAHILRKDYLQNWLLTSLEVLFFYHPSIWWFTATLRSLREQSCDELAVQLGAAPMALSTALVHLEENNQHPVMAMAFSHKNQLLNRIQRLFNPTMKNEFNIQRSQAPLLICSLAVVFFMSRPMADWGPEKSNMPLLRSFLWDARPAVDTTGPQKLKKITRDNGKQKVELELKNEKINELKVND